MSNAIEPFELAVPNADLDDLTSRLLATRWPDPETDPRQGVALDDLRALCAYLGRRLRLAGAGAPAHAAPQFRTMIDGLGIHFCDQ